MPVRIRLSRGGAKKRPFYRIVVADSRRARDGKFIDRIGIYNPMLPKDNPERVKIDIEKAKAWISKGAQPSNRVTLFLSNLGVLEKPVITEKTKQHLPRKKTQEKIAAAEKAKEAPIKKEDNEGTEPAEKAKAAEGTISSEPTEDSSDQSAQKDSSNVDEKKSEEAPTKETTDTPNSESSKETDSSINEETQKSE